MSPDRPVVSLYRRAGFVLAGATLLSGGALHPAGEEGAGFQQNMASMLAGDTWVLSHALTLVSSLLLLGALIVGRREPAFRDAAGRILPVAIFGIAVWSVEALFHLLAVVDLEAYRTGGSTPVLSTHLALAVVGYPLGNFPLAVLALRLAPRWPLLARPVAWLGALGAVLFGVSAPLVVLSQNPGYSFLFPAGAMPLALWLLVAGLVALRPAALASTEPARTTPPTARREEHEHRLRRR
jgi:hypothetical protein